MPAEKKPLGININYLMDNDVRRPPASRPLSAALADVKAPYWRYPGGGKSNTNLWSVPPYLASHPTLSRYGRGLAADGNHEWPSREKAFWNPTTLRMIPPLDFDQFMALCRQAGCEPVIVVPYNSIYGALDQRDPVTGQPVPCDGAGCKVPTKQELIDTAQAWVRYANREHGYNIRYWEIGYESFTMATPEQYAADVVLFSQAMKAEDPTILVGANGWPPWFQLILNYLGSVSQLGAIDYLSVHEYPAAWWESRGGGDGYSYYQAASQDLAPFMDGTVAAINSCSLCSSADRTRLKIALTETNSYDYMAQSAVAWENTMGNSLIAFDVLGHAMERPFIEFAQLWNTRYNAEGQYYTDRTIAFDAFRYDNTLMPLGQALAIWGNGLLDDIVAAENWSPAQNWLVTPYATVSSSRRKLNLFLLNKDFTSRTVAVDLANIRGAITGATRRVLKSAQPNIRPDQAEQTVYTASEAIATTSNSLVLSLDPVSITALDIEFDTDPTDIACPDPAEGSQH